jgi:hypothetical protein
VSAQIQDELGVALIVLATAIMSVTFILHSLRPVRRLRRRKAEIRAMRRGAHARPSGRRGDAPERQAEPLGWPGRPDTPGARPGWPPRVALTAPVPDELVEPLPVEPGASPDMEYLWLAEQALASAGDRAAATVGTAEREAAELRRWASAEAAAARGAAEQEVAELRAAVVTLASQLRDVAERVTGRLAIGPGPAAEPDAPPRGEPQAPPDVKPGA